jgi:hypothetical protein
MMRDVWLLDATPFVVSRTIDVPDFSVNQTINSLTVQYLPTDPIGTHSLTLTNVVTGSHIWIGTQDGTATYFNQQWGAEDYAYDQALLTYDEAGIEYNNQYDSAIVIPVYSAGSALNDWRIRIRKGTSAPYYIPYETLMTATVGSSSIYVSQIPDE